MAGAVFGEGGVWLYVAGAVLGDILGDSRTAKCCIFQYKSVAEFARGRSPMRRVRDDDFILDYPRLSSDYPRLSSDYPRLSSNRLYIGGSTWGAFTWDLLIQDYVAGAVFGEGGVWLYVAGAVLDDIHFPRQAHYLVRLEGDFTCSAHCKWRFICDEDQAGAVRISTGVVLASYFVVRSSAGVVLCSTE